MSRQSDDDSAGGSSAEGVTDTDEPADSGQRRQMLDRLHEMTGDLLDADTESEVYAAVSHTAADIIDLPLQVFLRYDAENEQFEPIGDSEPESTSFVDSSRRDYYLRVLESGDPVSADDVREDPAVPAHDSGIRSECLVPVGEYGVFVAASTEPDDFDALDVSLAKMLATNTEEALQQIERQRQRREHARQLRTIVDNVPVVLSAIDADGKFTLTEGKALEHFGSEPGDNVGDSVFETYPDYQNMHDHLRAALDGEPRQFTLDFLNRVFDTWFQPISDPETPVAVITAALDVTERTRRERLIQVLNRFLRHNLSNELNVILGNAETTVDHSDQAVSDATREILETSERLDRLASKARRLIKLTETDGGPEKGVLSDTVRRTVERIEREHDVSISTELPAASVQIEQSVGTIAVRELVENAIQHGSEPITLVAGVDDGRALITVRDDGDGLPEHEHLALTAPEETPLEHGSGLGLFAANWVVTQAGGDLTIDDVDDGTQITVTVPTLADGGTDESS